MFNYEPLWKTMKTKGVSQYRLLKEGIDNRTLANIKKGKAITMVTLTKLCKIIGCTPNDVVEIV
ncbi:MAG: helix-turn-helix domain-containing protein [Lachnospiraceae bacterium]